MRRILTIGDRLHFEGNLGVVTVKETFSRRDLIRVEDECGWDKGIFEVVGEPWVLVDDRVDLGDDVKVMSERYLYKAIEEGINDLILVESTETRAPNEKPLTFWISRSQVTKAEKLNPEAGNTNNAALKVE